MTMPSNKRARQKAARQARLRAEAARRRRKRIITQAVVFLALVAVVIVILALLNNGGTKTVSKKTTSSALFNSSGCPPQWSSPAIVKSFTSPPPFLINKNGTYYANFYTDVGTIKVLLDPKLSPVNVNNFIFLACHHFYDNTVFHRVIPGFVDQGGSPNPNNPNGGPGYSVIDEYPKGAKTSTPYQVGQLAMANTGAGNSAGSQFFFVVGPNGPSILDQDVAHGAEPYTIIGNVVSGMSVVEKINQDGSSNGTPKVLHKLLKVIITK
jgi:peptidylprolyl isomerase